MATKGFVSALSLDALTPAYDRVLAAVMRERRVKADLLAGAGIGPGHAVLDFGCGTATLSIMAMAAQPSARVVGVDVDPRILAIARRKAAEAGADVRLDLYDGSRLPYPDGSFDRVLSSLVVHHLLDKALGLGEMRRVLRDGGSAHILDIGPPAGAWSRAVSAVLRHVEPSGPNLDGRIPALMAAAGFRDVAEDGRVHRTLFGTLHVWRARA